jgi:hypothetical protein
MRGDRQQIVLLRSGGTPFLFPDTKVRVSMAHQHIVLHGSSEIRIKLPSRLNHIPMHHVFSLSIIRIFGMLSYY